MEPIGFLFLISIAMFIGSYIAGSLPLFTHLSDRKMHLLNALGAGLFIGTSLMVVIPEGVETIYLNSSPSPNDDVILNNHTLTALDKEEDSRGGGEHTVIGLALIIGFSLMFAIDRVSSLHMNHNTGTDYTELHPVGTRDLEENNESKPQASTTLTIGLVVHAAADGIALGASVSNPQLSIVVFFAVMLHKAPASFALTSVLLANGLPHASIRKHLTLFALSAPFGAILTYFILSLFSVTLSTSLEYWTGFLLVFSGGTFLYVAMHSLQEVTQSHNHANRKDQSTTFIILGGMLIPVLFNIIDIE